MVTHLQVKFEFISEPSSYWAQKNPILRDGEPGKESDTGRFFLGDGVTPYSDLPKFTPANEDGVSDEQLIAHINSLTPHPIYDDGPSLALLYQNAKV